MHTYQNKDSADAKSADAKSADAKSADAQSADAKSADAQSDEALDRLHLAYGRKVQELLSSSDAATWVEDLWEMYTGFTLFAQDCGADPKGHNRFVSFKELVFFFQDIGRMTGRLEKRGIE